MLAEYIEIEEVKQEAKPVKAVKENSPHFIEIIRMLENWGTWARVYYDGTYPHENMIYKLSKQAPCFDIVDDEIEIIDNIIKEYKNSQYENEKDWHTLVSLKYKGVEYIENGTQTYDCLNEFEIAKNMECSRKTVNNKFHKLIDDLEVKIYINH